MISQYQKQTSTTHIVVRQWQGRNQIQELRFSDGQRGLFGTYQFEPSAAAPNIQRPSRLRLNLSFVNYPLTVEETGLSRIQMLLEGLPVDLSVPTPSKDLITGREFPDPEHRLGHPFLADALRTFETVKKPLEQLPSQEQANAILKHYGLDTGSGGERLPEPHPESDAATPAFDATSFAKPRSRPPKPLASDATPFAERSGTGELEISGSVLKQHELAKFVGAGSTSKPAVIRGRSRLGRTWSTFSTAIAWC